MGFQTQVNSQPAPAVAGDFASQNPRASVLAGPGALVAGVGGVFIGRFAWQQADGRTVLSRAASAVKPTGFVHREQQGIITAFLAESTMLVREGYPITLHNEGDFWVKNQGSASVIDSAVYANYANGDAYANAAPTGTTGTGSVGATFTASGAGNVLTVSALTGYLAQGDTLGTTTGIPAGTTILNQLTGTAGAAGTYTTSVATTISAAAATSFGTTLNVTAVTGTVPLGEAVAGTGLPTGAVLTAQLTGATGGTGLYTMSAPATAYAASTALTFTGGILTSWKAKSVAATGELMKISTWGG